MNKSNSGKETSEKGQFVREISGNDNSGKELFERILFLKEQIWKRTALERKCENEQVLKGRI